MSSLLSLLLLCLVIIIMFSGRMLLLLVKLDFHVSGSDKNHHDDSDAATGNTGKNIHLDR